LTDTANEIVARLHPKLCSSGTMRRPGAARMAAAVRRMRKVTAATIQA
jgi:hypothetical protein